MCRLNRKTQIEDTSGRYFTMDDLKRKTKLKSFHVFNYKYAQSEGKIALNMDSYRALGLFLAYFTVSLVEGGSATFSIEDTVEFQQASLPNKQYLQFKFQTNCHVLNSATHLQDLLRPRRILLC